MSGPTADVRVRILLLALLATILGLAAGAGPARADSVTTLTLTVDVASGVDVNTYTGVRMHAELQPTTASGHVSFYIDGDKLGTATLVDGVADIASTVHVGDGAPARAVFEPTPGSGFASTSSPDLAVAVKAVPRVWLVDQNGDTVAARARLTVGQPYRLMLSGFRYLSRVRVTLGTRVLASPRVGSSGTASVLVTIPSLKTGTYQLIARSEGRSASLVLVVVRPAGAPTPTASSGGNVSVVVPSSPLPSTGGNGDDNGGDDGAGDDDNGGGGSLAHTGAQPVPLLELAAAALVLGTTLVLAAGRRPRGRHRRHA